MLNLTVKLTKWLLRNVKLKGEKRIELMSELLRNLNAFPVTDAIKQLPDGTLMIKGKPLSYEDAKLFIESAQALDSNYARQLFHEQIMYEATKIGVRNGNTPEQIMFSKAAIWWGEQERTWVSKFIET